MWQQATFISRRSAWALPPYSFFFFLFLLNYNIKLARSQQVLHATTIETPPQDSFLAAEEWGVAVCSTFVGVPQQVACLLHFEKQMKGDRLWNLWFHNQSDAVSFVWNNIGQVGRNGHVPRDGVPLKKTQPCGNRVAKNSEVVKFTRKRWATIFLCNYASPTSRFVYTATVLVGQESQTCGLRFSGMRPTSVLWLQAPVYASSTACNLNNDLL